MTRELIHRIVLGYQQGTSDKIYDLSLVKTYIGDPANATFRVEATYGRRLGTQQAAPSLSFRSLFQARRTFDDKVNEKRAKGYRINSEINAERNREIVQNARDVTAREDAERVRQAQEEADAERFRRQQELEQLAATGIWPSEQRRARPRNRPRRTNTTDTATLEPEVPVVITRPNRRKISL